MIRSFRNKDIRLIYGGEKVKKWLSIHRQIEKKLQILDMATNLEDLKHLPGNRFKSLKVIETVNIAFELIYSGESAFDGKMMNPLMLRSLIIIK